MNRVNTFCGKLEVVTYIFLLFTRAQGGRTLVKAPGQILVSTIFKNCILHSFPLFLRDLSVPNCAYFFLHLNRPFAKKEEEKKKEKMKAASASFSGEGNRDREKILKKVTLTSGPSLRNSLFPSPLLFLFRAALAICATEAIIAPARDLPNCYYKAFPPIFCNIWRNLKRNRIL